MYIIYRCFFILFFRYTSHHNPDYHHHHSYCHHHNHGSVPCQEKKKVTIHSSFSKHMQNVFAHVIFLKIIFKHSLCTCSMSLDTILLAPIMVFIEDGLILISQINQLWLNKTCAHIMLKVLVSSVKCIDNICNFYRCTFIFILFSFLLYLSSCFYVA